MKFARPVQIVTAFAVLALGGALPATALELYAVQFPERRALQVDFLADAGAPEADLKAAVLSRDGQARITLIFDAMKPAVLYGGDVTCYVVWAVTLSGDTENLGELLVREPKGRLEFATGKKEFALLVTAEPYYLVSRPSKLVAFSSAPFESKRESSVPFTFDAFAPAPEHAMKSIRQIAWDSDMPLELLQARKAYDVATQHEAAVHAPRLYTEAGEALGRANEIALKSRRSRELFDHARRSVALSNEAINMTVHRLEASALEKQVSQRRAEMEQIERRAHQAEAEAEVARSAADASRSEQRRLASEIDDLLRSRSELEASLADLRGKTDRLALEKQQLRRQLESALSHVADTQQTARGLVVSLPDILFGVNQATLKAETEVILAKLSGILLMLPELKVTVEGHTDSTGSADYNLQLSEKRALSVLEFVEAQGVDVTRLASTGFGMSHPVANNTSADGRARNRRVEIIIGDVSTASNLPTGPPPQGF